MEYALICLVSGFWAGYIAKRKGSSFWIFALIGVILPFIGVLVAVLHRSEKHELRKQCPTCGRIVPLHDALCTRCGTELGFPEVAIEPASATEAR